MQFTYEKAPSVPVGQYVARFLGVQEQQPPPPGAEPYRGRNGQPMAPGLIWQFEIIEGEHQGKIVDRLSQKQPTPKSTLAALLAGISGVAFHEGTIIVVEQFIGKLYRVNVEDRETGDGTRLSTLGLSRAFDLESLQRQPTLPMGSQDGPAPAPAPTPGSNGPARVPTDGKRFWVRRGAGLAPEMTDTQGLIDLIAAGADPNTELVNPAGTPTWIPIAQAAPELTKARVIPF